MSARLLRRAACLAAALALPAPLAAQRLLLDEFQATLAPQWTQWRFGTPLPQDSLRVRSMRQATLQFGAAVPVTRGWRVDATASWASGTVRATNASGAEREVGLEGLTDVRLRLTGRLLGDRLTLVLGGNIPTGRTALDARELEALRVLGSPAFRLPVPALGVGPAGSAGLVSAWRVGGWALGAGATYEVRGRYAPVEALIVGLPTSTSLDPGDVLRLSLGVDRLLGEHRLSLMVAGELFGRDAVRTTVGSGAAATPTAGSYRLGPALTATAQLALAVRGFRSMTLFAANRYRSGFDDATGARVGGSSGNQFDAGLEAVRGRPGRIGVLGRVTARWDTGFAVDNSVTTAAIGAWTGTLGLVVPAGRVAVQPFVQGTLGRINTGLVSSTANGWGAGLTVTVR